MEDDSPRACPVCGRRSSDPAALLYPPCQDACHRHSNGCAINADPADGFGYCSCNC